MRIALVILHADPARGGAERYTVDLAAAIARREHDVTIVSSEFLGASGFTRTARYRAFLNSLDEHVSQTSYDIVHAMLPVTHCDIYHPHAGLARAAALKWNAIFNPRRRCMAEIEMRLLTSERPPVVLALSEYSKRDVLRQYPSFPPDRLATLFNAVDLERFKPCDAQRQGGNVAALMIANDFTRKGLAEAIRAMPLVGDDRLTLHVAGKQDVAPFRREAIRHRANVVFAGQAADPRPLYWAADFFVLPTKHDPCSLVVLEALAMGLPVISTKFNGACEIMTDGVHGFVLDDPRNVNALADAMRKMLDPQRRAEMSKACIELRPRLSNEHHLDRLIEIYRQVQSAKS